MEYRITPSLNQEQIAQARQLVQTCWSFDKTARAPYLSNMLNFDETMPAFVLAYEGSRLIAFLAAYADDKRPELSIYVHPDKRQQGIARKLYQTFVQATEDYGLESFIFVSEASFMEQHPTLPAHWNLAYSGNSEFLLERKRQPFEFEPRADLVITQAKPQHIQGIATFQAQAFDNPLEETLHYAKEAVEDQDSLLYIVLKGDEVLASCTVDLSSDNDYLYGLAVKETMRGKGIGTYLVKWLVNDRIENGDKRAFQLAVDQDNTIAKTLYEKLGFVQLTEIVYYQLKKES